MFQENVNISYYRFKLKMLADLVVIKFVFLTNRVVVAMVTKNNMIYYSTYQTEVS